MIDIFDHEVVLGRESNAAEENMLYLARQEEARKHINAAQFSVNTYLRRLFTSACLLEAFFLFLAVRKGFSPVWLPTSSLTWWHAPDLGGNQEKPPSSASVGPCLFPVAGFLGYCNFTSVSWKPLEGSVTCLVHKSLETYGGHSPV